MDPAVQALGHTIIHTDHMDIQAAQADQAAQVDQVDQADQEDQAAQVCTPLYIYFVKQHNYVTVIPGYENVPTSQLPSGVPGGPGGPGGHGGPGAQL